MAAGTVTTYVRTHQTAVVACLGYALFLASNATVVWGGVFPFLPLEIQTPAMTSAFFVAQASMFALRYLAGVLGAYRNPSRTRSFRVFGSAAPYLAGWSCLVSIPYLDAPLLYPTIAGGLLMGWGTAGYFIAWQRLFAAQKAAVANLEIIAGTAAAPLVYFLLYLIPQAVTALLVALVFMPLFSLCIVLTSRSVDLDSPPFCDVPRDHPQVYRLLLKDYWRSALCVGSVAFSCGVIRALATTDPQVATVVNSVSMAALFAAAVALLALWRLRPVRLNIAIIFHVLFPVVTSAFIVLPVLGSPYLEVLSAVLYALYSCVVILTMIQCAQAARDRSVNPVFIYGFVAGVMYALHDVGFVFGSYAQEAGPFGMEPLAASSLVAVYMLGIMFFLAQGGLRAALSPNHLQAGRIELVLTSARGQRNRPTAKGVDERVGGAGNEDEEGSEPAYTDKISKQCALLQTHFKLSNREIEIVEAVSRGYTVGAIAQQFSVSENTVRTHMKRLYSKLDIHKKQQLVDLVRTFDPDALNAGERR